jgi:ferrochelatase
MTQIDSVLFVGFGAPRKLEQVMPFLRRVVRGRNVPDERLLDVAHHYELIGGSPYNELAFRQVVALKRRLRDVYGFRVPVYGGMRNWHPFLTQTIRCMNHARKRSAAGVILASHRSGTSLERYQQDVREAIDANGGNGPEVRYLDPWFDDPLFIHAVAARMEEGCAYVRGDWPQHVPIVFTAHSIPMSMAAASPYEEDLKASCRSVGRLLQTRNWHLAYQSRSGDGRVPWLEPDINDTLRTLSEQGYREVVVQPIGFLHDHVEVLYDLDHEAQATAADVGVTMRRTATVGDHPLFIDMLARRVLEMAQ